MNDGYTPRAGTIAQQVIEHLESGQAGSSMSAAEIANEFDCTVTSVSTALKQAVEAGALVTAKEGRHTYWSLPEQETPAAPDDGRLQIASWNDGDVMVRGGGIGDDGSVTYTREQILQLFQHVTVPHIAIPFNKPPAGQE